MSNPLSKLKNDKFVNDPLSALRANTNFTCDKWYWITAVLLSQYTKWQIWKITLDTLMCSCQW